MVSFLLFESISVLLDFTVSVSGNAGSLCKEEALDVVLQQSFVIFTGFREIPDERGADIGHYCQLSSLLH